MAELITSEQNPLLKEVRRAASRGSLTSDGHALAEGLHLLEEALASQLPIGAVITVESTTPTVEALLSRTNVRVLSIPDKVFAGLSSTETPQGVLTLVQLKEWTLDDLKGPRPLIILLDGVQDPGNSGAVVRSAEAFGATGVVFLKDSVHAYNPKCLRGSAGSVFRVPIVQRAEVATVLDFLKSNQISLYAAMPRARLTVEEIDVRQSCAFAVGSEAHGVSSLIESSAVPLRIPTNGVESLNAAVAAAVLLYEVQRHRRAII